MALSDWTFDAAIDKRSPNDSPSGAQPAFRMRLEGNGSGTREINYGRPVGTTVNGADVSGINSGMIECWFSVDVHNGDFAAQNRAAVIIGCRYTDALNLYRLVIWKDLNTGGTSTGYIVEKVKAGVVTTVFSGTLSLNISRGDYYKLRFFWWVAAGVAWFKVDFSQNLGITWVQQGAITADSEDFNNVANNKVVMGVESGLNNSNTRWGIVEVEDIKIWKAI